MLGSDGLMDHGQGHPRAAGAFPRFLAEFSRKGDVRLYDAVAKITTMAAERLHFDQKGRLNVGADADVTVFDYEKIQDRATFAEPALAPEGIEYVFIAGEPALVHGEIVNGRLGRSLRK